MFREEATSALAGGEKTGEPGDKPSEQSEN